MDIALVFAPAPPQTLEPFGSEPFLVALRAAGLMPSVLAADNGVATALQSAAPRVVHTFGDVSALAPTWAAAADAGVPIVHVVGSTRDAAHDGFVTGLTARRSSHRVSGLIGSNRADLGRVLDAGYFPRAGFSLIAPPPVTPSAAIPPRHDAPGAQPVFGHFDPQRGDLRSLDEVLRAIELTGQPEHLTVRFAREDRRTRRRAGSANLTFVAPANVEDFISSIDVLLVTEAADRLVPSVAAALSAGRIVIAPDAGVMAELLEYGRHGVLYTQDSAYHLATAINEVAASWQNRPFDFASVETALARLSPDVVAATFREACLRLAS